MITAKTIALYIFLGLLIYFILGGIIFNHIIPSKCSYELKEGMIIESKEEGFIQKIIKIEQQNIFIQLTMQPMAAGPPMHIHETFDEYFVVKSGIAGIIVNGKKQYLKAGESILINKGTPHKIFNETQETVVIEDAEFSKPTMSYDFACGLTQLYPAMDKISDINSPKVLLQLAAQGNQFDTWLADVPLPAQKTIRWLLGPTARMLGYGNVYRS
jgi:mannose-6-phosphate isomerase-like protein (cupin superfamily)